MVPCHLCEGSFHHGIQCIACHDGLVNPTLTICHLALKHSIVAGEWAEYNCGVISSSAQDVLFEDREARALDGLRAFPSLVLDFVRNRREVFVIGTR